MKRKILSIILISILLSVSITSCTKENFKMGFVSSLSGRYSTFGIEARNGAKLAIENINELGGINGRQVELIIKDDEGNPEKAEKVDLEFVEENIKFIIGHSTSNMSNGALKVVNNNDMLMISPTMSTNLISNKDDNFFRVTGQSSLQVDTCVQSFLDMGKVNDVAVVYDVSNKDYTRVVFGSFKDAWEEKGGKISEVISIRGDESEPNYKEISKKIVESGAEGLFLVTSGVDSALICQGVREVDENVKVVINSWAFTKDFLDYIGKITKDIYVMGYYDPDSTEEVYLNFKENYINRFGTEPTFSSLYSYDAVMVLKRAIEHSDSFQPREVKKGIIEIAEFEGIQNNFKINKYGDAEREYYIMQVKDGKFVRMVDYE